MLTKQQTFKCIGCKRKVTTKRKTLIELKLCPDCEVGQSPQAGCDSGSNSTGGLCPEGCKLVAVLDGCGESAEWGLYVQDKDGNDIGILAWPDCFGERADENDLIASGFECRRA